MGMRGIDRYWLLTTTTYGARLPGDPRGFVSNVRDDSGTGVRHNVPGTSQDADMPNLQRWAGDALRCPAIRLIREQAAAILAQFRETADHRDWLLLAVAIMADHFHLVVGVPGDPEPAVLLRDFKSYASRALNRRWPKPASGTWWTESGSRRRLRDEAAVMTAIHYVSTQEFPLGLWTRDDGIGASPAGSGRQAPDDPPAAPAAAPTGG